MSQQSSINTSTIVAISVGTVVTGLLAYAVYFDSKRRSDPEFRKALKKESKRTQRAAKEAAEQSGAEQKKAIRAAVALANEEGFPKDPEEVEAYFMQEVAQGEGLVQKGALLSCLCGLCDGWIGWLICFVQALITSRPRCASTARSRSTPTPGS